AIYQNPTTMSLMNWTLRYSQTTGSPASKTNNQLQAVEGVFRLMKTPAPLSDVWGLMSYQKFEGASQAVVFTARELGLKKNEIRGLFDYLVWHNHYSVHVTDPSISSGSTCAS
ncbi:MAG: hypothetical protein JSU69_02445, partial [Candidatus Zixiibacteriota bacterium]